MKNNQKLGIYEKSFVIALCCSISCTLIALIVVGFNNGVLEQIAPVLRKERITNTVNTNSIQTTEKETIKATTKAKATSTPSPTPAVVPTKKPTPLPIPTLPPLPSVAPDDGKNKKPVPTLPPILDKIIENAMTPTPTPAASTQTASTSTSHPTPTKKPTPKPTAKPNKPKPMTGTGSYQSRYNNAVSQGIIKNPRKAHLTRTLGVFKGPSGRETYYNLKMDDVIETMRRKGFSEKKYPYWVRDDGVRMLGNYVIVAANLKIRPKGTIIETSLGTAIVCDTGGFVKKYPKGLDIAVNW
jgi:hypothetical protein